MLNWTGLEWTGLDETGLNAWTVKNVRNLTVVIFVVKLNH